ncbi:MAG: hypothetical protein M1836_005654 [Candelina mexicana]|nr:MAG: hypothetical protein M1836_005654 [Candelina mexicana]
MPYFIAAMQTSAEQDMDQVAKPPSSHGKAHGEERGQRIRVKNRRKRYLDLNPDYFSSSLELADPLLYDRLIRRFQSTAEREAEGRSKGYSGILEADLMRSEAKVAALANPDSATMTYKRGPNGEIYPDDKDEVPSSKEEGERRWKKEMEIRFLRGDDNEFEYQNVDDDEQWDNKAEEEREEEEKYFAEEEPRWISGEDENSPRGSMDRKGETGVLDY